MRSRGWLRPRTDEVAGRKTVQQVGEACSGYFRQRVALVDDFNQHRSQPFASLAVPRSAYARRRCRSNGFQSGGQTSGGLRRGRRVAGVWRLSRGQSLARQRDQFNSLAKGGDLRRVRLLSVTGLDEVGLEAAIQACPAIRSWAAQTKSLQRRDSPGQVIGLKSQPGERMFENRQKRDRVSRIADGACNELRQNGHRSVRERLAGGGIGGDVPARQSRAYPTGQGGVGCDQRCCAARISRASRSRSAAAVA